MARRLLGFATTVPIVAEGTFDGGHRWTLALGPNTHDDGATAEVCVEQPDGGAITVGAGRYPQPDGTVLGGWGRGIHDRRRFFCWCTTLATTGIQLETGEGALTVPELAADPALGVRVFLIVVDDAHTAVTAAAHLGLAGAVEEDLADAQSEFEFEFARRAIRRPLIEPDES